ncbi:hypothetical protein RFN28_33935, partial [Mesorhizobium sp. VK24D]|nr:hypothetical protein [Mesorhizobium sp. VK24D]
MEHKPALYVPTKLHAEIGRKLQANQVQREKPIDDMKHVEAVLHMLEPDFNGKRCAKAPSRSRLMLVWRSAVSRRRRRSLRVMITGDI